MNFILYLIIFIAKTIELALGTLRLIVVANGKKTLGAILQGIIAVVWICITGVVVNNITSNPLKIVAFALGCMFGSYIGSLIEEKMAMGSNMLIAIVDKNLEQTITTHLRGENYAVTVLEGKGKEKERSVLMIMVARKKRHRIVNIIKQIDFESLIIAENAFTINGGHDGNEKSKN